ncbi:unnamed protein product [Boreogadus saida]
MSDTQPPEEDILGGDHVPIAEAPGSPLATEPQAGELQDSIPHSDMELQGSEQEGVSLPEKRSHGGLESLAEQPVETQNLNPPPIELRRESIAKKRRRVGGIKLASTNQMVSPIAGNASIAGVSASWTCGMVTKAVLYSIVGAYKVFYQDTHTPGPQGAEREKETDLDVKGAWRSRRLLRDWLYKFTESATERESQSLKIHSAQVGIHSMKSIQPGVRGSRDALSRLSGPDGCDEAGRLTINKVSP